VRWARWRLTPWKLIGMVLGLAGLIVLLNPASIDWSWRLILMLLYDGPLATAFAFWAAVSIQRALPSTTVSLSYLAVPAWGLAASTLWLGEALPASLVLGGLLILLGVAAIAIGDIRRHSRRIVGYTRGCNVRVPPRL
jgi:drug/metabolite transporter (DMT)-like permease